MFKTEFRIFLSPRTTVTFLSSKMGGEEILREFSDPLSAIDNNLMQKVYGFRKNHLPGSKDYDRRAGKIVA